MVSSESVFPDRVLLRAAELEVGLRELEADGAHFLQRRFELALLLRAEDAGEQVLVQRLRDLDDLRRDLAAGFGELEADGTAVVRIGQASHPAARLDAVEDTRDALRLLEEQRGDEARLDRLGRKVEDGEDAG